MYVDTITVSQLTGKSSLSLKLVEKLLKISKDYLKILHVSSKTFQASKSPWLCPGTKVKIFSRVKNSFGHETEAATAGEKETLTQVFSCEFYKISKNTFSYRIPPVAASVSKVSISKMFFLFIPFLLFFSISF